MVARRSFIGPPKDDWRNGYVPRSILAPFPRDNASSEPVYLFEESAVRKIIRASVSAGPGALPCAWGDSYDLLEVSPCACFIALLDSFFTCAEVSVGLIV